MSKHQQQLNRATVLCGTGFLRLPIVALVIMTALIITRPANSHVQPEPGTGVQCSDCHTCGQPTLENPCLHPCPRPRATKYDLDHSPKTVILDELEWEYEAVVFSHRRHAEMSGMSGECGDCHHYSEGRKIGACKECHPAGDISEMYQPGLKGAYHRQCMSCHQDWSGVTSCEMCHLKKAVPGKTTAERVKPSEPSKRFFPSMAAPDKKVWHSTYGGGTIVTFFHRNHTEKYGVECATCHHAEGCGSCHRKGNVTTQQIRHSEEALHGICNGCHAEMSCNQCHLDREAEPFSHDRTGWPLGKFHSRTACRKCHGDPNHFRKPSPVCNGCHGHWNVKNFNHARTGFALNEAHKEIECESCHAQRAFATGPTCTECHGTDFSYPAQLPGEYVKGKR